MRKVERWRTFTSNRQKNDAALPANVLFREILNETSVIWLPSDNQAYRSLIHYQVKALVLRTWEVDKG
jgi:hypothetical protein